MPPLLPTINWQEVFESGLNYETWLVQEEKIERRERIIEALATQVIPPGAQNALQALTRPVYVVAIAEAWCGDVIRHAPVLQRMAGITPMLRVRYITRGERLDVFSRFLTNGGEAIPKFIFLNDNFTECGTWGPMQEDCKRLIARGKACGDVAAARQKVNEIYAADTARQSVVEELMRLIEIAGAERP